MQLFFSLGLLVSSLAFTIYGLSTLDLLDSLGRPGPGYFPLMIGVALVVCTAINSVKTFKERALMAASDKEIEEERYVKDTVVVVALITLFLVTLNILGSILSMILFLGLFLSYFNKGKLKFNIIYGLLLPIGVHVLFDVLLRAGLPKGILGIG